MSLLLQIKTKRDELIANGIKPGFYSDTILEQINGLIDVNITYTIYLYKSISDTPQLITIDNLDQLNDYTNGYYMYEIFRNEFVTKYDSDLKRNVTSKSTFLIQRSKV